MAFRNRITRTGSEAPDQLLANPRNWRVHPQYQERVLAGVLNEVGWVDHVIVNERTGFVVDGHERIALALSQGEATVPVTYVDLTEEEEALVLATFDPIGSLAQTDGRKLNETLDDVQSADAFVQDLVDQLRTLGRGLERADGHGENGSDPLATDGPQELLLQPFEQFDYVVLLFRNTQDFSQACERLGITKVSVPTVLASESKGLTNKPLGRKIGLGRAVDGAKAMERLCKS